MGKRGFIAILFLITLPNLALAAPTLRIDDSASFYSLGMHADILEDAESKLTPQQLLLPQNRTRFTDLDSDIVNLGFTDSSIWIRVEVLNTTATPQPMILQQISSWIDQIDLTIVRAGGMETRVTGEMFPFLQREIANPRFLFAMDLEAGERILLLIRAKSEDPIQLPMTLWKKKEFDTHNLGVAMYFGLVFGCLLAVMFYNFFLFFSLRDNNYLYYVAYIASLLFMIFTYSGNSYQNLWPESPRFQSLILFATGHLSMFFALAFAKQFLSTATTLPRTHKFLTLFQGILLSAPAIGAVAESQYIISASCTFLAMVFPLMQAVIGIMAYRNNVRSARYFILAWSFSMFGILFTMGSVAGLYPSTLASQRSMEMGLVIDAILLSFALADKIKILRLEKQHAEDMSRRALFQSKEQLEAKVEERTAELTKAKETAEAATLLKEKFLALVSHDLRAPVGAIQGFQEALLKNPQIDNSRREDFIRRSANAAERMLRMIDQLLNITRLNSGMLTPIFRIFSAKEAVAEAATVVWRQSSEKKVEVVNNLPEDMILLADRELVEQVFFNLLSNAIKFTQPGGRVVVGKDAKKSNTLVFADNGVGVPERFVENLFRHEIKTSTPGTAGEKGAGLGLPYCHDLIEAHGGELSYRKADGGGSEFRVTFPQTQRVLLLVDDQQIQRDILKETILERFRISFVEAENGLEALAMLKSARPLAIITDLNMPEMNGMELLIHVKNDPAMRDIPMIIATSDYSDSEQSQAMERQALGLGAVCVVAKPVDPGQLIPILTPFLSGHD